jgi:hypothetical protein
MGIIVKVISERLQKLRMRKLVLGIIANLAHVVQASPTSDVDRDRDAAVPSLQTSRKTSRDVIRILLVASE